MTTGLGTTEPYFARLYNHKTPYQFIQIVLHHEMLNDLTYGSRPGIAKAKQDDAWMFAGDIVSNVAEADIQAKEHSIMLPCGSGYHGVIRGAKSLVNNCVNIVTERLKCLSEMNGQTFV